MNSSHQVIRTMTALNVLVALSLTACGHEGDRSAKTDPNSTMSIAQGSFPNKDSEQDLAFTRDGFDPAASESQMGASTGMLAANGGTDTDPIQLANELELKRSGARRSPRVSAPAPAPTAPAPSAPAPAPIAAAPAPASVRAGSCTRPDCPCAGSRAECPGACADCSGPCPRAGTGTLSPGSGPCAQCACYQSVVRREEHPLCFACG